MPPVLRTVPARSLRPCAISVAAASFLLLTLLPSPPAVLGYGRGPPATACERMTPSHAPSTGQSLTDVPYLVQASKTSYAAEDVITVTVRGQTPDLTFKGLMLQARDSGQQRAGTFALRPGETLLQLLACNNTQATAVVHNSPDPKTSISVDWQAPASDSGPLHFRVTVVQQYDTFYVGVVSASLTFASTAAAPTGPVVPDAGFSTADPTAPSPNPNPNPNPNPGGNGSPVTTSNPSANRPGSGNNNMGRNRGCVVATSGVVSAAVGLLGCLALTLASGRFV